MKFSIQEIRQLLTDSKPIWNTVGNVASYDWVIFRDNKFYAFNGYSFYSKDTDISFVVDGYSFYSKDIHFHSKDIDFHSKGIDTVDIPFAVNAVQLEGFIRGKKEGDISVEVKDGITKISSGKSTIRFTLPLAIEKYLENFYSETEDFEKFTYQDELISCFNTVYKENLTYSNVYLKNNKLFSLDGYRVSVADCDIAGTTSFPFHVQKMISNKLDIEGIRIDDSVISFKFSNGGIFTAVKILSEHSIDDIENNYTKGDIPESMCKFEDIKPIKESLQRAKKIDIEFKQKDIFIEVKIRKNNIKFAIMGRKFSFEEEHTCSVDVEGESVFKINPVHLEEALTISDCFFFSPNLPYIVVKKDKYKQYIWVEN